MHTPAGVMPAQTTTKRLLRRMAARNILESSRVSTPLELLFDLTFVVAIAAVAAQLHHAVAAQHLAQGLLGYVIGFAAIWWAWMNFSCFASAYDTDDTTYRLWTMVQMVGVLILALGLTKIAQGDFATVTIGYAVMRIGLVALWLRAAREHPERRRTAMRYALGILGYAFVTGSLSDRADQSKMGGEGRQHTLARPHTVSPTQGIGLVAAAVAVFLTAVWWLHRHIARGQAPLAWAIPAVTAAPAFVIAVIEHGRLNRPELFHGQ